MTITELITELERLKKQHGDMPVKHSPNEGGMNFDEITDVYIKDEKAVGWNGDGFNYVKVPPFVILD